MLRTEPVGLTPMKLMPIVMKVNKRKNYVNVHSNRVADPNIHLKCIFCM